MAGPVYNNFRALFWFPVLVFHENAVLGAIKTIILFISDIGDGKVWRMLSWEASMGNVFANFSGKNVLYVVLLQLC